MWELVQYAPLINKEVPAIKNTAIKKLCAPILYVNLVENPLVASLTMIGMQKYGKLYDFISQLKKTADNRKHLLLRNLGRSSSKEHYSNISSAISSLFTKMDNVFVIMRKKLEQSKFKYMVGIALDLDPMRTVIVQNREQLYNTTVEFHVNIAELLASIQNNPDMARIMRAVFRFDSEGKEDEKLNKVLSKILDCKQLKLGKIRITDQQRFAIPDISRQSKCKYDCSVALDTIETEIRSWQEFLEDRYFMELLVVNDDRLVLLDRLLDEDEYMDFFKYNESLAILEAIYVIKETIPKPVRVVYAKVEDQDDNQDDNQKEEEKTLNKEE